MVPLGAWSIYNKCKHSTSYAKQSREGTSLLRRFSVTNGKFRFHMLNVITDRPALVQRGQPLGELLFMDLVSRDGMAANYEQFDPGG
ncbi:hypothetical protein V6N13_147766 [Hibiscus sabdariffa]